jgi:molybdopterin molybdotransferase
MALLSVADALESLLRDALPIEEMETVPLGEAAERVLATDLVAHRDQPPFPASAMDGYAVRAEDADRQGQQLAVVGEAAAGHAYHGTVEPGQAVRIFTGAPVPPGADAVLIQENARLRDGGAIEVLEPVERGRFVRPRGLDFAAGETVLSAGAILDAGRLTVAAAMNVANVAVRCRPTVAILATGDELVAPGAEPGPDQIIASNSFGVAAIARRAGARVVDLGIVPDSRHALEQAIGRAERLGAHILVTLGGASVGDHDLVQAALRSRGMQLAFWKIAMRPGKPLMSGRLGRTQVLGLPGNPVSSLVCSHLFLVPLIRRLSGQDHVAATTEAVLGADLPANDQRQDYLRSRLERDAAGRLTAHPFPRQDSSMMRTFADADGLIIRPPHAPAARRGETCRVLQLR